ncbi:MAG: cysteine synthase A [Lachnospiraceae bacterium]|nr:cysteine synthase A [Lachnospiraceae bacterium]MBQ9122270.1 cysteine synthase A [Lachnospiraceae bacterium]
MNVKKSVLELVGNTPILEIGRFVQNWETSQGGAEIHGKVFAKLEYLNPAGSIKDRVALEMILDAEEKGILQPGATIIEPTSGNTGIGLAIVAAARGYEVILTLPDTMSVERRTLLSAYGAKLELTEGKLGMSGAIAKAEELKESIPGAVILGQFDNEANPKAHQKTTGPEIWGQMDGKVDVLVAGVGTGGTLTGIGSYLKSKNPDLKVIAIEPAKSPVLSKGESGAHGLQGIGAGFVPSILDVDLIDEVITVTEEDAYVEARRLAKAEGVLVGISSGAALAGAMQIASRAQYQGKNVVVILPDSGDRYLSTALFQMS